MPYAETSDDLRVYFNTLGDLAGIEEDQVVDLALRRYQDYGSIYTRELVKTLADELTRSAIVECRLLLDQDVQVFYEVACECFEVLLDYLLRLVGSHTLTHRLTFEGIYEDDLLLTSQSVA